MVSGWVPAVAVVALSMVLGNMVAIVQSHVKRLLAYSAIAHAGYALLGLVANSQVVVASPLYYVITYALTIAGAFGVVAVVERQTGEARLADFAGLHRRAPVVSFCMMIFLLSLAGIPPLAGFFGKFYVFAAAVQTGAPGLGLLWLVILAIAMSAVSLYYYLQVLKQIYIVEAVPAAGSVAAKPFGAMTQAALAGLAALVVVLFGLLLEIVLGWLARAMALAGL